MAETIGTLIDKITITELKIYHMREQLSRNDAPKEHKDRCAQKIEVLKIQTKDLQEELTELFNNVIAGKAKLKIYRQFKMYNDTIYRINGKDKK